jgi:SAM-dependent methyltransferase
MATEHSIYTLNSGTKNVEEHRLNRQHKLFKKMTHGLLPTIISECLSTLGRPPTIADVGTGTGNWLRDLACTLPPTSRLDGYDLDTTKFPEGTELPTNVKLSRGDVLKPFPAELSGMYDLVHVRLLMYALKADEWEQAVSHMRTLLRPGGYLMWEDTGYTSWQCLPMTEDFMKVISTDVRYAISLGRDIT